MTRSKRGVLGRRRRAGAELSLLSRVGRTKVDGVKMSLRPARRSRRFRGISFGLAIAVATLGSLIPAGVARASTLDYSQIVQDEAYWISTAQIPDGCGPASGALAWYPYGSSGLAQIRPYVANIGAMGMLAAGPRYYPMVKAWIGWYIAHLNRSDYNGLAGTVYDYDDDPISCTETTASNAQGQNPSYDSTDAYAGTFLSLLKAYAQADPSEAGYVQSQRGAIRVVADVIAANLQSNGLTIARPDYQAQYLMDNVEAEQGLADYAWLSKAVLGDRANSRRYEALARTMRSGINHVLWVGSTTEGMYGWAADQLQPSWSTWYVDSVSQTWPIRAGLANPQRRAALWASFNAAWPEWTSTANNPDGSPWCSVGYTAALMGDRSDADAFLAGSQTAWVDRGRPWPFTILDSANRALTAATVATM